MRTARIACGILLLCAVPGARAQPPAGQRSFSVVGTGEVHVMPDRLELEVQVAGRGEIAEDALVKYRSALDQLRGAIAGLENASVEIALRGAGVGLKGGVHDEDMEFLHLFGAESFDAMQIDNVMTVTVTGLANQAEADVLQFVVQLVDRITENGGAFASSRVKFVVADAEQAREQASKQAYEDARKQAESLASFAQAKVGRLLTIDVLPQAARDNEEWAALRELIHGATNRKNHRQIACLAPIPIRVELSVRFEIE